mgnify:CR=1 FL=1
MELKFQILLFQFLILFNQTSCHSGDMQFSARPLEEVPLGAFRPNEGSYSILDAAVSSVGGVFVAWNEWNGTIHTNCRSPNSGTWGAPSPPITIASQIKLLFFHEKLHLLAANFAGDLEHYSFNTDSNRWIKLPLLVKHQRDEPVGNFDAVVSGSNLILALSRPGPDSGSRLAVWDESTTLPLKTFSPPMLAGSWTVRLAAVMNAPLEMLKKCQQESDPEVRSAIEERLSMGV